jgi:hypothetical protein
MPRNTQKTTMAGTNASERASSRLAGTVFQQINGLRDARRY